MLYIKINAQNTRSVDSSNLSDKTTLLVKKSTVKVDENYAHRTFEVDVTEAGDYFLSAWLMGAQNKNGDFYGYNLMVNQVKQNANVIPTRSNWQSVEVKDRYSNLKTVVLIKGKNIITLSSLLPEIPNIEFIKIGKAPISIKLDNNNYTSYIKALKQKLYQNLSTLSNDSISVNLPLRTAQLNNPEGNYSHRIRVPFSYTTYKSFHFSANQQVFFTTYARSGYEHQLDVFSYSNPDGNAWTKSSNSQNLASLNITIPQSGTYVVRIRSYRQGTSGLVDLNVNGEYYYADCAVSGNGFRYYTNNYSEVLNYFTCNNTGDPYIYIEDYRSFPGTICAFNDDYYGTGDFHWPLNSRVKKQLNSIGAVQISAYGSYNPTGICDLYMGCKNSNIMSYFPNLKADDAIQSAPASGAYNCTSWAGGITSFWYWGSTPTYYYGNPQAWYSWDDYFGNNPQRYQGAQTYTTTGATAENGVIAMWARNNGEITHGSVRGYSNGHPHGYAWESKPGSLMRTFHPRDALNGSSYGSIVKYYRTLSGNIYEQPSRTNEELNLTSEDIYTFEQSVKAGLTVIENITLNDAESLIVSSRNRYSIINNLYDEWINEINSEKYKHISNPYTLIKTESGRELLLFAQNNLNDAVLLFADKIFNKDEEKVFSRNICYYMFCEIAKNRYGKIMEQIKIEWQNNNFNKEGSYIAPLPETFTKKYIKEIIDINYNLFSDKNIESKEVNNDRLIYVTPNPISEKSLINISLQKKSLVSIRILNGNNGVKTTILNAKLLEQGDHSFSVNASMLPQGISMCLVDIDNETYVRKLLKK